MAALNASPVVAQTSNALDASTLTNAKALKSRSCALHSGCFGERVAKDASLRAISGKAALFSLVKAHKTGGSGVARASLDPPKAVSADAPPAFTAWGDDALNPAGKRTDIKKIMILGAGPIVIGQACEFDYSGTQACKALKEEGYEVILINSNPATIMTDPGTADRTYVAPMTPELVEQVIANERPDALLPTMGGQTALNLAVALSERGTLDKYGVELIGAKLDAINKAEDRDLFKRAMDKLGIKSPKSGTANTLQECFDIARYIGDYPLIIRPAFTLGGSGGGIAYNEEEFETICKAGLSASATSQVLIDKSLLGWKEYELEVMRDLADNVVIICSIENIDPMGVHTGDSITVAPAQTLTDKEYQRLRDYSVAIIREIGVECGGSNVQFAINPKDGEVVVIEMNPRVSRSSALASKATGFPIAKMAAKLSVGYTLDRIPNDITKKTPASFEPSIDYVVTKIPRFAFEKFPGSEPTLTTQMKSVGEAMAIGRTFQESFQKALRSLETGHWGWGCEPVKQLEWSLDDLKYSMRVPNPDRMYAIYAAMKRGMSQRQVQQLTNMDPWYLSQMGELLEVEDFMGKLDGNLRALTKDDMQQIKRRGYSDRQIAFALKSTEEEVRSYRLELGVVPAFKRVDTCAAEFEAMTPYQYSSYDEENEGQPDAERKVLILGGGPNRIGQGIEFDYCCCHASFALQAAGFETIMMNSNPETVSTDYDTSNRLYFEPLTVEDVINVINLERPDGIIVQFGGQTPLKLAVPIQRYLEKTQLQAASGAGPVRIWGTSPDSIDAAEDRKRFEAMLNELGINQPPGGIARSEEDALAVAKRVGYPVVVRPSYVLGGRAMEIVYNDAALQKYLVTAVEVDPERPVLVDKYLANATELDVDCLADSTGAVTIGGIMEHIEQAGVHSGDSACSLPTQTISEDALATIRDWTTRLARKLNVVGLMNCQYAVMPTGEVYIIEANPRASRTVPFVAKAIGHPLAKYASLVMAGKTLQELGFDKEVIPNHVSVKEAVLPFDKFPGCDVLLGPEMRSTGEVMGLDATFEKAFLKAQVAANQRLPTGGSVFVSLNDLTKESGVEVAKSFVDLGFKILATEGTANVLEDAGIEVERVLKLHEGRPHAGDLVSNGQIQLLVITSAGDALDQKDGRLLRRTALGKKVPIITTMASARATVKAIRGLIESPIEMKALQDYYVAGSKEAIADAAATAAAAAAVSR
ncbi:unnamed protein product [Closterium sp. NIES-64]|nr:unnamed protein product [Closterium sp. NIES-65]CAI5984963.1 unnamed protein product [Closterium sp. NIES-64]